MGDALWEDKARVALEEGRRVELRGHTLTAPFLDRLERVLGVALRGAGREELLSSALTVARELAIWSSFANMRQVYFEECGLDLRNPAVVADEESRFQASVSGEGEGRYRARVRDRGLYLRARIGLSSGGLRIEILSNALHSETQEELLRARLRDAMGYADIMDYFRDHPEDADGRGLGLAFSILALRGEGLQPELMRMGRAGEAMVSRLEIPLDDSFTSIRDRIRRGETVRPFENAEALEEARALSVVDEVVRIECPLCGRQVDEQVFFQPAPDEWIDLALTARDHPTWTPEHGACATCLATFAPTE